MNNKNEFQSLVQDLCDKAIAEKEVEKNEIINQFLVNRKHTNAPEVMNQSSILNKFCIIENEMLTKIKNDKDKKHLKGVLYNVLSQKFFDIDDPIILNKRRELEKNLKTQFFDFFFSLEQEKNAKKYIVGKKEEWNNEDESKNFPLKENLKSLHKSVWESCEKSIKSNYSTIDFVPKFLLFHEKNLLKNKVDLYMEKEYSYPIEKIRCLKDLDYKYLREEFHRFINDKVNLFDDKILNEEKRKIIYELILFSNLEYIKSNEYNKKIFCNNLRKYIIILGLKAFHNKFVEQLTNYLITEDYKDKLKEVKDKFFTVVVEENHKNFLFFLFSLSSMFNSLAYLNEEGKIVFPPKLKCSAKERQFLINVLQVINGYDINYIIEKYVIDSLIKSYTKVLYDENNRVKVNLNFKDIMTFINNLHTPKEDENVTLNEVELAAFCKMFDSFVSEKIKIFSEEESGLIGKIAKFIKKKAIIYAPYLLSLEPIDPYQSSSHICIVIEGSIISDTSYFEDIPVSKLLFSSIESNADFYYFNWQNNKNRLSSNNEKKIEEEVKTNKKVAKFFGKFLAYIISSRSVFKFQSVSLLGISIGAEVIKNCLLEMNKINEKIDTDDLLNNVIFIGGATTINKSKYPNIFASAAGRIINVYSEKDDSLKKIKHNYIGNGPLKMKSKLVAKDQTQVENIDMTYMGMKQEDYKREILTILQDKIKLF